MTIFQTVGKDGMVYKFQYKIEPDRTAEGTSYTFSVYLIPPDDNISYQHTFKRISPTILHSSEMTNNGNPQFSKKGIPEKIIEIAADIYNCDIISSPLIPDEDKFLTPNSQKVWERLVCSNPNAKKDEGKGYFILEKKASIE